MSIPQLSRFDSLRFVVVQMLPRYLQGTFHRCRFGMRLTGALKLERRAVMMISRLRSKYGSSLFYVRTLSGQSLVLLDVQSITSVLARSPDEFAEPSAKRRGMKYFQPDAVTISRGDLWQRRRSANIAAVGGDAAPVQLLEDALAIVEDEIDQILPSTETLAWKDIKALHVRLMARLVFGTAKGDVQRLWPTLSDFMLKANRLFMLRRGAQHRAFEHDLHQAVEAAPKASLAGRAGCQATDAATTPSGQVPHWMFALADTLAMNVAQCLALVASHPEIQTDLRETATNMDLKDPNTFRHFSLLTGCVQEAMRLWPTTPMLARESIKDTHIGTSPVPAGTPVFILNNFTHRDRRLTPWSNRFNPSFWQGRISDARFNHLSNGQQVCAGRDLAVLLASAVVAQIISRMPVRLVSPALSSSDPLPYAFNPFEFKIAKTDPAPE